MGSPDRLNNFLAKNQLHEPALPHYKEMFRLLVLPAFLALALASCGSSNKTETTTVTQNFGAATTNVAKAAFGLPFEFRSQGDVLQVRVDRKTGSPPKDVIVSAFCADLGPTGFTNKDQGKGVWKQGTFIMSAKMDQDIGTRQLCAIKLEKGKEVVAFFNKKAEAAFVASQK